MKLAPLLAEFLYQNKRLDLPGIGSFLLDPTVDTDSSQTKPGKSGIPDNISFESNTSIKESPDLISFIASATGKIKALAAADLDSHLELARQFLNIGKPFLFEGIGTLSKLQAGQFSFSPGVLLNEKVKDFVPRENAEQQLTEDAPGGFKTIFYGKKTKPHARKALVILLLFAGLVFAIWGGYTVYKKTTSKNNQPTTEQSPENRSDTNKQQSASIIDTSSRKIDTGIKASEKTPAGTYKFVVETADKTRGLKRYSLLKGFGLDVKMETADSVSFKIYFLIPSVAADTSRLLDSLRRLYTPLGNKAYIEN